MNKLYPGFSVTPPQRGGRVQRLEKGSQRMQRGQFRPTSGTYARLPSSLLTSIGDPVQVISISNPGVRLQGGASVTGNTQGFAYTATATSITWYWDGTNNSRVPVIQRGDGTRFTVPTSGSGLTVSGLIASTTYYFLPFWNVNSQCNIGWVEGTQGSPQIAFLASDTTDPVNGPFYLMEQTAQSNEPLSTAYMTAVTPASGSTSGTGAGGGGSGIHGCVMAGTDIQAVGDLPYSIEVHSENEWIHLRIADGRDLYCTYNHPLYHTLRGRTPADALCEGDYVITDKGEQELVTVEFKRRVCSKHKVIMSKGHLFWANGLLSHNVKPA